MEGTQMSGEYVDLIGNIPSSGNMPNPIDVGGNGPASHQPSISRARN